MKSIVEAVNVLANGGIIALPSEGVYGLSCDPKQLASVKKLCEIKERPENKGFVLVAASMVQLEDYIQSLSEQDAALLKNTWPGPVTWIVPVRPSVSPLIRGAHQTIAVRVTAHPILAEICRQFGGALISTSANKNKEPPIMHADEINTTFSKDQIDYIVEGSLGNLRGPTEIRDLQSRAILRPLI